MASINVCFLCPTCPIQELDVKMTRAAQRALKTQKKLEVSVQYTDKNGQRKVKGGKHLKATQAYPEALGHAVAAAVWASRGPLTGSFPPMVDSDGEDSS